MLFNSQILVYPSDDEFDFNSIFVGVHVFVAYIVKSRCFALRFSIWPVLDQMFTQKEYLPCGFWAE